MGSQLEIHVSFREVDSEVEASDLGRVAAGPILLGRALSRHRGEPNRSETAQLKICILRLFSNQVICMQPVSLSSSW